MPKYTNNEQNSTICSETNGKERKKEDEARKIRLSSGLILYFMFFSQVLPTGKNQACFISVRKAA